MDAPQENPDGYEASSSVLPFVDNLSGRLLLVHGTDDRTVMWSQAMAFVERCVALGKQIDLLVYPMQQHALQGPSRKHFFERMTQLFLRGAVAPARAAAARSRTARVSRRPRSSSCPPIRSATNAARPR